MTSFFAKGLFIVTGLTALELLAYFEGALYAQTLFQGDSCGSIAVQAVFIPTILVFLMSALTHVVFLRTSKSVTLKVLAYIPAAGIAGFGLFLFMHVAGLPACMRL